MTGKEREELTESEAEDLLHEAVENLDDVRNHYPNLTDELERLAWTARTSLNSIYFRVGCEDTTPSLTEQARRDASPGYSGSARPDRRADGSFVYGEDDGEEIRTDGSGEPGTERWYVCTDCETDVRARWNPPSASFYIGCSCTSVPTVPQMGQFDTPDNWRVKRPECCADVDNSELRTIHSGEVGHDYECPDCQAVYRWDGCMVERPDEPGEDLPDDQSRLLTDGGPDQTGTERDDLEGAVGDYGDLVTSFPRLYCEECERFIYVTWQPDCRETAFYLECECRCIRPDNGERPDCWRSIVDFVDDGLRADGSGEPGSERSEPVEIAVCDEHGRALHSSETGECVICAGDAHPRDGASERREPDIFDIVELPESEKGAACPMLTGEEARRCNDPVEFVFVQDANADPDDDRRQNTLSCADCKPEPKLATDGGTDSTVTERPSRTDQPPRECGCCGSVRTDVLGGICDRCVRDCVSEGRCVHV